MNFNFSKSVDGFPRYIGSLKHEKGGGATLARSGRNAAPRLFSDLEKKCDKLYGNSFG